MVSFHVNFRGGVDIDLDVRDGIVESFSMKGDPSACSEAQKVVSSFTKKSPTVDAYKKALEFWGFSWTESSSEETQPEKEPEFSFSYSVVPDLEDEEEIDLLSDE